MTGSFNCGIDTLIFATVMQAPDTLRVLQQFGALLLLAAVFGARLAGFPFELPLGLFASLIGAPWLIWLMMRRR